MLARHRVRLVNVGRRGGTWDAEAVEVRGDIAQKSRRLRTSSRLASIMAVGEEHVKDRGIIAFVPNSS